MDEKTENREISDYKGNFLVKSGLEKIERI